jgi:TonB family protein
MRYLISFVISFICIIFIFIFPFPDIVIASKDTIILTEKERIKSFTIMNYTVLPETPGKSQENTITEEKNISPGKPDTIDEIIPGEDEINEDNKKPEEEAGKSDNEETNHNETEHEITENTGGPEIVDYHPDFSTNKKPVYPAAAKRMRQQGSVLLKITIDGMGSVINIEIEKSSGYVLLDNAAIEAVKKWDFTPLVRHNKRMIIRTTITFTLKEKGK